MYNLDQTWIPFSSLMLRHIYNVLLVCSDYDRFMLEEDGRVEEELYKEYMELGLSTPPKITHTSSTEEAMDLIGRLSFDLVITMIDFHSGKVEAFARKVKSLRADMPVIVLAPSPDHRRMKALKEESCDAIDQIFYWQGDATLFLAMVKLIEDSLNLDHDTSVADVQVIVLIEDSIHFISSYLPVMYTSLIKQTRLSILEALNEWGKTLRMRGRPKIVLARSGEQALEYYRKYRRNILGIITDVNFPYEGQREGSGLRLARQLRDDDPDLPILIQSTDISNAGDAAALKADFIWKNSPNLLSSLENHFIRCYNFGPFDFIDPASGETILSARTMKEVQNAIRSIPAASLLYHSRRNDFSRWLRAQSMYQLASIIEGINIGDEGDAEDLRSRLYNAIREYRIQRTRGAIAQFSPDSYDDTSFFSRIGSGSLGGKGRGLAFIAAEMMAARVQSEFPSIYLSIPKTVVVSTQMYDEFLSMHGFDLSSLTRMEDDGCRDSPAVPLKRHPSIPRAVSQGVPEGRGAAALRAFLLASRGQPQRALRRRLPDLHDHKRRQRRGTPQGAVGCDKDGLGICVLLPCEGIPEDDGAHGGGGEDGSHPPAGHGLEAREILLPECLRRRQEPELLPRQRPEERGRRGHGLVRLRQERGGRWRLLPLLPRQAEEAV